MATRRARAGRRDGRKTIYVRVTKDLHRKFKIYAAKKDKSIQDFVIWLFKEYRSIRRKKRQERRALASGTRRDAAPDIRRRLKAN